MTWLRSRILFVVLPFSTLGVSPGHAQSTGGVSGVVRDVDQSVVAGVAVTATNAAGIARSATTGVDGRYTITGLTPGVYTVSASQLGFRGASRDDVRVEAGAAVTVDLVLEPLRLEAFRVTAMLREQELIDVPFSITAPTAQTLRTRGALDIEGIAANVAGFSVQNLGPGQSQPAVRGASSGQIARDQPGVKEQVSVYLDDTPISLSLFTPDLDLFDLSRVEVLRGPQGTLFGAGSMGGTVRYITNAPELGTTNVFGEVGGSLLAGGGPGGEVQLGVNLPLGDRSALRAGGYLTRFGGYMDARTAEVRADTIAAYGIDEDVNTGTRAGVRATVRIQPTERFTITPRFLFQRVEMDGWNRIDDFNILANPFTTTNPAIRLDDREQFLQIDEPFTDDFMIGDLNVRYDFAGASLTSVTSYTRRDILVVRDAGALTSSITGGSLGLPERIYLIEAPLDDATESTVFTQEIRLASTAEVGDGGDAFQWLLGGFFSSNARDYGQSLLVRGFDVAAAPILGAPVGFTRGLRARQDELFYSDLAYDLKQFAVFGEATLPVGERLRLTGGLRFYSFDEEREQVFDGIFGNDNTGSDIVSQPGSTDATGIAPRFIASLRASEDVTINAQAARGFRLGGINDPLNVPLCTEADLATFSGQDTWDDEKVWNWELGAKSRILGGRGTLNVSAFYMDISDLQVVVTAGSCSSRLVLNAPEARTRGLEAELAISPSDAFDLAVSASWNDATLESRPVSVTGQPITLPGVEPGNRLPSVPKLQASAAATYRWDVGEMPAYLTASYQHVGSRITAIDDHALVSDLGSERARVDMRGFEDSGGATIGGPLSERFFTFDPLLPAYNLLNLRLGVIRGHWEIALSVNNLTDERAFLALDRERGTRARVGYLTNPPRTFALSVRFQY